MTNEHCVIRTISGDEYTPLTIALRTHAVGLLESAYIEGGKSRYSMILIREACRLIQRDSCITMKHKNKNSNKDMSSRSFLQWLRYFSSQHHSPRQDFPFPVGGIGYFSYEYAKYCDSFSFATQRNTLDQPEAEFIIPQIFAIYDHYSDLIYLVGVNYKESHIDIELALNEIEEIIRHNKKDSSLSPFEEKGLETSEEEHVLSKNHYMDAVETLRGRIAEGWLLQAVPSRRAKVLSAQKPIEVYRRLRAVNPASYMFYLNFGSYQLLGMSPESHLTVKKGIARMTPIAGTRLRGHTREEDLIKEKELLADKKERAEHLMLVDLARNDMGRICVTGSVKTEHMMRVEKFAKVMHMVTDVNGVVPRDKDGLDLLATTFPAGTVSGAPKMQAVSDVSSIEPERRGFYAGVTGYIEPGGDLDTCITIRSILCKNNAYYVQAGAGVVFDSSPAREFTETEEKLSGMMAAFASEESEDLHK